MRISTLFLVAALTLGLSGAAFAKKKDEIAQIQGVAYYQKDFLPKKSKKKHRFNISTNRFRSTAEAKLVEIMFPQCRTTPTDAELSAYRSWWASGLERALNAYRKKDNQLPGIQKMLDQMGDLIADIRKPTPKVTNHGTEKVSEWLRYLCIESQYPGGKYNIPDGAFDRKMREQFAENPTSVLTKDGFIFASVDALPTPIEALGRLYTEAEAKGILVFSDHKRREFFFGRYSNQKSWNVEPEDAAEQYAAPYWNAAP